LRTSTSTATRSSPTRRSLTTVASAPSSPAIRHKVRRDTCRGWMVHVGH
jgi:hypothetical protein